MVFSIFSHGRRFYVVERLPSVEKNDESGQCSIPDFGSKDMSLDLVKICLCRFLFLGLSHPALHIVFCFLLSKKILTE